MKITRRGMAAALLAPAAAALAQTAPARPPQEQVEAGPVEAKRADVRKNAATLAAFDLPMAIEPAFRFEA